MNVRKIFQRKNIKIAKYAVVIALFAVWVVFLDVHSLKEHIKYRMKIHEMEDEKAYYIDKIKEDSIRLHELNTSDENLEKYAREKYYMKKKGEEIFLVKKKENN